jgi:hypothetical protein
MDEVAIQKAFVEASLAASTVMRCVLASPTIAKSEGGTTEAATEMARVLVRRVAIATLRPVVDIDKMEDERIERLEKNVARFEKDQAERRADGRIHDPDCECDPCSWQRHDDAAYEKLAMPHLDEDRGRVDGDLPTTPGFIDEPKRLAEKPPAPTAIVSHAPSKSEAIAKMLAAEGWDLVDTDAAGVKKFANMADEILVHPTDGFAYKSAWSGDVMVGQSVADLTELLSSIEN